MNRTVGSLYSVIVRFLSSRVFLYAVFGLFFIQTILLALTMNHPGVYDEDYHVGIIEFYSHQIHPFVSWQPESTADLGDLTGFTSFLYQFLLSFIYRIFDGNLEQASIIYILRVINSLIFGVAFVQLLRWLRVLGFKDKINNIVLLIVTTFPFVPLLAATVNYESLFLLLAFSHLLYFTQLIKQRTVERKNLALFLITGSLGIVTKYTFAPLLFLTSVTVFVYLLRKKQLIEVVENIVRVRHIKDALFVIGLVSVIFFGGYRYIVNITTYGAVSPACDKVHTVDFCRNWNPWRRNDDLDRRFPDTEMTIPRAISYYLNQWSPIMINNVGLIGGYDSMTKSISNTVGTSVSRVMITALATLLLAFFALGLLIKGRSRVAIVAIPLLLYVGVLFYANFADYSRMGVPLAIQTRYALAVVPLILSLGIATYISTVKRQQLSEIRKKAVLLFSGLVAMFVMSQYAGLVTIVYVSEPGWFRSDQIVQDGLQLSKKIVQRIVIDD